MNYENFKTGLLRLCIFLTVLIEAIAWIGYQSRQSWELPFGITFRSQVMIMYAPLFIWGSFFFILWIYKGFLGKK